MDIYYKKSGSIFNQHQYWTKQPLEAIDYFILKNTLEGETVLDPFCGTGMTGVSGIRFKRNVILSDISPVCKHISSSYTTYFDTLQSELNSEINSIKNDLQRYYYTKCNLCDNDEAEIIFSVLEEVFYNSKGESQAHGKELFNSIKNNLPLPPKNCDKSKFKGFELIQIAYKCKCTSQKQYKDPQKIDFYLHETKDFYDNNIPKDYFFGKEPARNYKKNIRQVRDLYSNRNLTVLSRLKDRISKVENKNLKSLLNFAFTSILFNCSLMSRYRSYENTSIKMGTFYIPQVIKDNNVLKSFLSKVDKINRSNKEIYEGKDLGSVNVIGDSAGNLKSIQDNSIDYIYTDPPYGDILSYSELNIVWESWLDNLTDTSQEMIISKEVGKTEDFYFNLFEDFLCEASRVLKKGKKMTLIFHHPKIEYWKRIQDVFLRSNFEPIRTKSPIRLVSKNKTSSQHATKKNTQSFLSFTFINRKKKTFRILNSLDKKKEVLLKKKLSELENSNKDYKYDFLINELFSYVKIDSKYEELINSDFSTV